MWFWSLYSKPPNKNTDIEIKITSLTALATVSSKQTFKERWTRTQPMHGALSQRRSWLHVTPPNNSLFNNLETILSPTSCPRRSHRGCTCQWCNQRKCRIRTLGSWNVSRALQETDTNPAPCVAWFRLHIFLLHVMKTIRLHHMRQASMILMVISK